MKLFVLSVLIANLSSVSIQIIKISVEMLGERLENYWRRADKESRSLECKVTRRDCMVALWCTMESMNSKFQAASETCGSHVPWTQPVASLEHGRRKMFA